MQHKDSAHSLLLSVALWVHDSEPYTVFILLDAGDLIVITMMINV